jgi:hypothetical protein
LGWVSSLSCWPFLGSQTIVPLHISADGISLAPS